MRRFQKNPAVLAKPVVEPSNESIDTNLSIESMSIDQILKDRLVPSLEDEVEALQEADGLQEQANQDVAETTRVEDVTDVVLNVADTLEGADEITPQQAMLVDTVSEMAVAGSDGDPDDVMPTASDVVEGNVTLEAFIEDIRQRAKDIWERIRKFCLEIWNTIKEFFKKIFFAAPRLLNRVKELRALVDAREAKTAIFKSEQDKEIRLVVGANAVSYPEYMVHNTKELTKGLSELQGLAKYAFGGYIKECKAMGDKVASELKKFNPKEASSALKAVANDLQKHNFVAWPGNPSTGYLGCFDVVPMRLDKNKTKDLSDAQIVGALRGSGMRLQQRHGRASVVNTQNAFATMSFSEMKQTLKAVEYLVKQVVAFESSADGRSLEKTRQDLIDGGNHASGEIGKLVNVGSNDPTTQSERQYAIDVMKSLMNFNTTLTRWMTELTMPVTKKIYQTARTSLVLVEKSISAYATSVDGVM